MAKHTWLAILLVIIFASRFVVGGVLYHASRKYQRFLFSPEGKLRRAQEVEKAIAATIADAEARATSRTKLGEVDFNGISPSSAITEARRLARNMEGRTTATRRQTIGG